MQRQPPEYWATASLHDGDEFPRHQRIRRPHLDAQVTGSRYERIRDGVMQVLGVILDGWTRDEGVVALQFLGRAAGKPGSVFEQIEKKLQKSPCCRQCEGS